jgi:rifampicin phosphotransferase
MPHAIECDLVVPLGQALIDREVGGKARNLARLIDLGVPVPEGVVVTNAALQLPGLPTVLDGVWQRLSASPLIVRSSAVGEDSDDASFAGQLDSIADVRDVEQLRRAVIDVWSSRLSPRVLAYQQARGASLAGMGVIVQRQIDSQVSGVLFTESPDARGQMLVEYCGGMGEQLVSGRVNPGRFTVDRETLRIVHQAQPDERLTDVRLLNDVAVRHLARTALQIERAFGRAQDIEWTLDEYRRLWIVQSRPITTGVRSAGASAPLAVLWSNANVNENFPQPICPLLHSVARAGYYHYFRNLGRAFGISRRRLDAMEGPLRHIIGVHGARMYYNLTSIHGVLRGAPFGDLLTASFNQFVGASDTAPARARESFASQARSRLAQAAEVAAIAAKTAWQYLFLTRRVERFERTAAAFAERTRPEHLRARALRDLLADFRGFLDIRCHRWNDAALADAGSMVCYAALQRLLARRFPDADQQALHNTLLKALPELVSSVPARELWTLSRQVRADADLACLFATAPAARVLAAIRNDDSYKSFRDAFERYLENWGFRCSAELMLTVPSFQEDPAPLIDLLKSYASMDGESPDGLLARQQAERVAETTRVMRALGAWRLAGLVILRWTQTSILLRERARLKQALLYSRLRRIVLAMGERLVERGRLANADDLFFLTAGEIDDLAAGAAMFPEHVRDLVALRRRAHLDVSATAPPDTFTIAEGEYLVHDAHAVLTHATDRASDPAAAISGVAACGGLATARATILDDVSQAHRLTAGDILVTRQTDPGWGPIFPLISGLVMERGGMLSHGAIIAREFGIPSVVGVKNATRLIPQGGRVRVDGNRGLVHLLGEA